MVTMLVIGTLIRVPERRKNMFLCSAPAAPMPAVVARTSVVTYSVLLPLARRRWLHCSI